ncbi:UDP-N-acetylglucosamine 4,6-dehydratase (inverting) [Eisenibacter elegans]|uniref:UDP-N-acetylglucosamine 4,6-dehydratase (inverting) n=1 Tax=Eisenibacter elegans TaxID=997 RepID=UPI0005557F4E|nr:UDP-N-acetylglucosamine 4,6-dehydratase (inverting) [Eisenibacter elegans]
MLNGKSILITGGTGSFGQKFVAAILQTYPKVKRVVIYSRDELKQFEMQHHTPYGNHPALEFVIGDIRDAQRLTRACLGIDYLIHAAALKHVPIAELNPMECIKTNVFGSENVINAALDTGVKKVIALSTDKAAAPINLYGATKLCADKLFIAANNMRAANPVSFAVVRYGNVMGASGSVIPFFIEKRQSGVLPITDPAMTRFNITPEAGVNAVLFALENALGGEIFVPRIPSFRIIDLAEAIAPSCEHRIVGVRPGEKLHEEMIIESDALHTLETADYFVIAPHSLIEEYEQTLARYRTHYQAQPVAKNFAYSSEKNTQWLDVPTLRRLIQQHVSPNFEPL